MMGNKMKTKFLCLVTLLFLGNNVGYAGTYTDSAHGNSTYGVERTSTAQYATGHCAHCHEQHASIDGAEPGPTGGPDNYLLFNINHISQTDNFCYSCHGDGTFYTNAITNYSYSRTFGGDTGNSVDDIKEAFDLSGSTHGLADILIKIKTDWPSTFNDNSNPCSGCHNPHLVQKKISSNTYRADKSALSRPGNHNELWGDTDGSVDKERMDEYLGASEYYRAPFYVNANSALPITPREPDRISRFYSEANGFNLTNFVTFCLDCHSSSIGTVKAIDWSINGDVHGKAFKSGGTDNGNRMAPYTADGTSGTLEDTGKNFVLSCMDCHEPHGSSNPKLLRTEVNNKAGISFSGGQFNNFCNGSCHSSTHNESTTSCVECHYHGNNL